MQTIEMIGPPGAGKTTISQELSNKEDLYFSRTKAFASSLPAGFIVKHAPPLWPAVRTLFSHVRPRYEREFISRYPGVLETIAPIIRTSDDAENVLDLIFREAAWFAFFSDHLADNETYVIDDGLYQFHLRLMSIDGWNATRILDRLHKPNKFIFVDAPAETCFHRQNSRPRGRASKLVGLTESEAIREINEMRSGSEKIVTEAKARDIEVDVIKTNSNS
ncbi:hypothetical protein AB7C87_09765 [Natrarchaeobius sp. A-rgal3]|uniref:AAA family ATPase n=1 Tax=Natrarchaeobius versutus TaxID=1679078 RepID=UPI0035106F9B